MINRIEKVNSDAVQLKDEIASKIRECIIFTKDSFIPNSRFSDTLITVEENEATASLLEHQDGHSKITVLNHASYKAPAQLYLEGSTGREEDLCDHSYLYNVLSGREDYYKFNAKNLNKGLYLDRGLYTPDIPFIIDGKTAVASVLSVTAPNNGIQNRRYKRYTDEENISALKSRLEFILQAAARVHTDILILGAFGCSVYGQDPVLVSSYFSDLLNSKYKNVFREVIFPVTGKNYSYFRDTFAKGNQV